MNHFARESVARIVPFLRYGITWSKVKFARELPLSALADKTKLPIINPHAPKAATLWGIYSTNDEPCNTAPAPPSG